jgi:hypothetical protein
VQTAENSSSTATFPYFELVTGESLGPGPGGDHGFGGGGGFGFGGAGGCG